MYQQAYQIYLTKCEVYGMTCLDFFKFKESITKEQIEAMLEEKVKV